MEKNSAEELKLEKIHVHRLKKLGFTQLTNYVRSSHHEQLLIYIEQLKNSIGNSCAENKKHQDYQLVMTVVRSLNHYINTEEKTLFPMLRIYDEKPTLNLMIEIGRITEELKTQKARINKMSEQLQIITFMDQDTCQLIEKLRVYTESYFLFEDQVLCPSISSKINSRL
ncbi:hypothetical protein ACTWQL_17855 [Pseudalkalibacillus sp. R45]|uniref:hypothetical protein n=1 Tax=Pseudalkalibacillus sp. R45 TaxID=3457433 RepID=UPI003FCD714A